MRLRNGKFKNVAAECRYRPKAVKEACFERFAVVMPEEANGFRRDDTPLEVWKGINFGISSYDRLMGKVKTAEAICSVVVIQVYLLQLQFLTPDVITAVNTFRACHYLRAMAIWGLWATHTD